MRKKLIVVAAFVVVVGGALCLPVGGAASSVTKGSVSGMNLAEFSSLAPESPLRLLFIHHSVGGQLFASPGPDKALADSIYATHKNGGGLRKKLEAAGYEVHETSYGSELGESTDLFDWLPKFRHKMDRVLRASGNDEFYDDDRRNQIVMFKSCYPNSKFVGDGKAPGNPAGPELTVANAQATLTALRGEFAKQPKTLFVYLTAPPVAPKFASDPVWKWLARKVLGKPAASKVVAEQARRARQFDNWVKSPDGWLKDYPHKNVVVFDYYDVLTDGGASNLSRYPTGGGRDSHPSRAGNEKAAAEFVPFLNRAVRRAGLSD